MRVSHRCYAVTGLGYVAPWCVNAGFVCGEDTTLIVDTGANALAAASIHGYATAVRPSNGLRVVNTEKHFDHIGGNSCFRERGVEIWGHAALHRTEDEFQAEKQEFNDEISNEARRSHQEAEVFYGETTLANPDHAISGEMKFELGECAVEVIFTPGHTPTNISLWVPEDGVLLTGDCLINGYLPNLDAGSVDDWKIWLTSLDRIRELGPRVVVAGHGPVAQGDEVGRVIDRVERILRESIARGRSPTSPHPGQGPG